MVSWVGFHERNPDENLVRGRITSILRCFRGQGAAIEAEAERLGVTCRQRIEQSWATYNADSPIRT